jgi:hypothetical protein
MLEGRRGSGDLADGEQIHCSQSALTPLPGQCCAPVRKTFIVLFAEVTHTRWLKRWAAFVRNYFQKKRAASPAAELRHPMSASHGPLLSSTQLARVQARCRRCVDDMEVSLYGVVSRPLLTG